MMNLFKKGRGELKAKRKELNSCKIALNELNITVENAKRDLKTGISRETVEKQLSNNFITKENADKIHDSISALEIIVNCSTPSIESLKDKISILEEDIKILKNK